MAPRQSELTRPELEVRRYLPGDEEALVAMFSSIFHKRSLAEWKWLFQQGPAGPADIGVLTSEGTPVGSIAHIPVPVWVEGRRLNLAIGCDMMVLPEYRGRGGAEQLVRAFLASDHGFDLNFGAVNEGSSHVTGRYMGTAVVGRVPLWIRFRRRGARRNAALRAAASLAERLYAGALSWPRPTLSVTDLEAPGSEVDELARASAAFAPCIRIRDSAYLRWHWLESPLARWRVRAVREGAVLRGLAVIGSRDEGSDRRGLIVDVLARDSTALRALLADAWDLLTKQGCHSVACIYHDPRPWAKRAMLRSGFRRSHAPGPRVGCGHLSPAAGEIVGRLDSWYLTYGDADM